MTNQIVVGRHGNRWAVRVAPEPVPVSEFDTQAEAESAARVLADESGGRVVLDTGPDPQRLGDMEDSTATPGGAGEDVSANNIRGETAASRGELAREPQQGL